MIWAGLEQARLEPLIKWPVHFRKNNSHENFNRYPFPDKKANYMLSFLNERRTYLIRENIKNKRFEEEKNKFLKKQNKLYKKLNIKFKYLPIIILMIPFVRFLIYVYL